MLRNQVRTVTTKKEESLMLPILKKLKEELDPNALQNMHIHISGISSNSKGDLSRLSLRYDHWDRACLAY